MKLYLTILFLLLGFCSSSLLAEETADSFLADSIENQNIIPLELDKEAYGSLKNDRHFDYYSYKPEEENAILKYLRNTISSFLEKLFQTKITVKQADTSLWIVGGIIFIALLILLIVFKPSLFFLTKKRKTDFRIEEESIEGMNFNKLIRQSLDAADYTNAVRWKYLQTLNALQEKELVSWNPNKTINEYVREMKRPDLKSDFKNLSQIFLYCRYGNWDAEQKHFDEAEKFSNEIIKRL